MDKQDKPQRKTSVSLYGINHTFNSPHEAAAFVNFLNGGAKYDPKAVEEVMSSADDDEAKVKAAEEEGKASEAAAEEARLAKLDPHEREAQEQSKNGKKAKKDEAEGPPARAHNPAAPARHATSAHKGNVKRAHPKAPHKPARRR